ncbi:MAG: ABC transporter permease [Planctomycetota bacterium]
MALLAAAGILIPGRARSAEALTGAFFGAAALLLLACLAGVHAMLCRPGGRPPKGRLSLRRLGGLNASRRRWRSLATVALLGCGSFVVVAVGVFRQDPLSHPDRASAGTGGFDFYGHSSLPVLHRLDEPKGPEALRVAPEELSGVQVVPLRLREGADASCLNLNRAQRPRVLGVDPRELSGRGSFTFVKAEGGRERPWLLLERDREDGAVPAVADQTTIQWALHKKLGDTVQLRDEAGRSFKLRLVGALANSILQGSLIISERNFLEHFAGEEGYRLLLIDAPPGRAEAVRKALLSPGSELRKLGLTLTPATQRLAAFTAVENTYISIFQLLGGLGLILGSVAMGIVVLRNVLERRSELALLRAVGYSKRQLLRLLLYEHWMLLAAGLVCGVVSGLLAAAPALAARGAEFPLLSQALTLAGVFASGALWVYLAARFAVRGELTPALRSE